MTTLKKISVTVLFSAVLLGSCKKDPVEDANEAPKALNVTVTGIAEVNRTLTATYVYNDAEGDAQAGSILQWYVANDGAGTNELPITGATSLSFLITAAQQGKYIRFGVTPKAATGTTTGTEVKSNFFGGIGDATTITFTYNGASVTYNILTSTTTGKKWLDRNLGAPNAPTGISDFANYGDIFQWGRGADGHQLVNHTGPVETDFIGINGKTSTVAPFQFSSTDIPGHSKFIVIDGFDPPFDWRKPQNNNLWQASGINNPCPAGWHVPTEAEWTAENITSITDGFAKLKITYSGFRSGTTGDFTSATIGGYFWSSTIAVDLNGELKNAVRIRFNTTSFNALSTSRGGGYPIRCIKN